jgi:threonine/homoserine/homoserine lactone efflux protein
MALTIAALTFLYCAIVISITRFAADRMRANPRISVCLNRIAGTMLLGFGLKLALGK